MESPVPFAKPATPGAFPAHLSGTERTGDALRAPFTFADGASPEVAAGPTRRSLERFLNAPSVLHFIRRELELLTMQVSEIQECCLRMLLAGALPHDTERDLYHLSARLDGMRRLFEEMIQVSQRLCQRPLRGGPDPSSQQPPGCSATPIPEETASLKLTDDLLVRVRTGVSGVAL